MVKLFQKKLYDNLLKGSSIQNAFTCALNLCIDDKEHSLNVCCCAHDHSVDCDWYKYALKYGFDLAHELHSKKCHCNLALNKHKWDCSVIKEFEVF